MSGGNGSKLGEGNWWEIGALVQLLANKMRPHIYDSEGACRLFVLVGSVLTRRIFICSRPYEYPLSDLVTSWCVRCS
jgi:hypothetical protein